MPENMKELLVHESSDRKWQETQEKVRELPEISNIYPTLPSILRKYARYGRKDDFRGKTSEEFRTWQMRSREILRNLLGLEKMDDCALEPVIDEVVFQDAILRYHILLRTEPDITLSAYLLVPASANAGTPVFLCPPGHNGAGKYTVAGVRGARAIEESIEKYNYDFGWQLARLGYVAFCPDVRGFGERREMLEDTRELPLAMKGDCYWLAHMGEPIGIPVLGMLSWDLMRCVDFLQEYTITKDGKLRHLTDGAHTDSEARRWNPERIIAFGFSGGAMQSLYLSALDERIHASFLSGYMYGFRDSLLQMNRNCSCNYVPHLMEHFDMGDIASLIAPRRLMIQSCREDRLAGTRGLTNVQEQVDIIRANYAVTGSAEHVQQDIEDGPHHLDTRHLQDIAKWLVE
ncbi:alpha/beta hydrolase family protein [Oribacterium sp. Sow4_G1_1]|uniref:alpha/beta hydrolase family protein n=1 Tax=Oribacterium sp. Sow4_G1_1 TaxID=3438794 RepID=UPI003F9493AA